MLEWLIYIVMSSFMFALGDVINDMNITNISKSKTKQKIKTLKEKIEEYDGNIFSEDLHYNQIKEINAYQDVFICTSLSIVEIILYYFIKIIFTIFDTTNMNPDLGHSNMSKNTLLYFNNNSNNTIISSDGTIINLNVKVK
jgi:hypothetical protein